jgi:hypothetical protein
MAAKCQLDECSKPISQIWKSGYCGDHVCRFRVEAKNLSPPVAELQLTLMCADVKSIPALSVMCNRRKLIPTEISFGRSIVKSTRVSYWIAQTRNNPTKLSVRPT